MRNADKVAAGRGRAIHRRVGQQHVLVPRGGQIDREGDVSIRTFGRRIRRAGAVTVGGVLKTKKSAALRRGVQVEGSERNAVGGARAVGIPHQRMRRGRRREHKLSVTQRRALDNARRAGHGREIGGIQNQLAGSVIDQTVAQAQPIVAGVDPDMVFRPRSP